MVQVCAKVRVVMRTGRLGSAGQTDRQTNRLPGIHYHSEPRMLDEVYSEPPNLCKGNLDIEVDNILGGADGWLGGEVGGTRNWRRGWLGRRERPSPGVPPAVPVRRSVSERGGLWYGWLGRASYGCDAVGSRTGRTCHTEEVCLSVCLSVLDPVWRSVWF